jgi:hypothetical protein
MKMKRNWRNNILIQFPKSSALIFFTDSFSSKFLRPQVYFKSVHVNLSGQIKKL